MRFTKLTIPGTWLIRPEPFEDGRGIFRRHFCADEFAARGLDARVAQANVSENFKRLTLRGFHWQNPPHGEAKTLSCLGGSAHVVVADLRPGNATYLKWSAAFLSRGNRQALHVPAGCATAFLSLEDDTVLHYYMSAPHVPDACRGLRHDDPLLGVNWPAQPLYLSERDRSWPDFVPTRSIRAGKGKGVPA